MNKLQALTLAGLLIAAPAFAQTPAPAPAAPPAPLLVPNPKYETLEFQTEIIKAPVDKVWARVGKYCDIGKWFDAGPCTMLSGKEGDVGSVRSINSEILVGKTQYSYTYTQPVRQTGFYNMVHGTMRAEAVSKTTSRVFYTLMFDNSNMTPEAAATTNATRRTRFEAAMKKIKILGEGGTLPAN
ncbi:MAG: Polyketide cyclase / dehydrase and lipid transport [Caulobacteraceae bacterium]|nr:Polyketide cyclase / dehydrase and lipid transport [Caulobacteraceae bacterium]